MRQQGLWGACGLGGLAASLLAGLMACGGDASDSETPADPEPELGKGASSSGSSGAPPPTGACAQLAIEAEPLSLRRGQQGTLKLTVTGHSSDDQVTVRSSGVPEGVSISAPAVTPGDTAPLELEVTTIGAKAGVSEIVFTAQCTNAPEAEVTTSLRLVVRGEPGELDTSYGEQGVAVAPPRAGLMDAIADGNGVLVSGAQYTDVADMYTGVPLLVRVHENGNLDGTFGDAGSVRFAVPPGLGIPYFGWSRAHQSLLRLTSDAVTLGTLYWLDGSNIEKLALNTVSANGKEAHPGTPSPTPLSRGYLVPLEDGGFIHFTSNAPSVTRYLSNHQPSPGWTNPDLAAELGGYITDWSVSNHSIMLRLRAYGAAPAESKLVTVNATTGAILSSLQVYEPFSISRPSETGERIFESNRDFYRYSASGQTTFTAAIDGTGSFAGVRQSYSGYFQSKALLLRSSATSARLYTYDDDNTSAVVAGVLLEGFTAHLEEATVINVLEASEGRALVILGANPTVPANANSRWKILRYWL